MTISASWSPAGNRPTSSPARSASRRSPARSPRVGGVAALINLVALLSVSIGLMNLFPVPMLDGGHLMFYAIEALRGRPLSERAQEIGFRIGLALVLMLMLFATWNDILSLAALSARPDRRTALDRAARDVPSAPPASRCRWTVACLRPFTVIAGRADRRVTAKATSPAKSFVTTIGGLHRAGNLVEATGLQCRRRRPVDGRPYWGDDPIE